MFVMVRLSGHIKPYFETVHIRSQLKKKKIHKWFFVNINWDPLMLSIIIIIYRQQLNIIRLCLVVLFKKKIINILQPQRGCIVHALDIACNCFWLFKWLEYSSLYSANQFHSVHPVLSRLFFVARIHLIHKIVKSDCWQNL